MQWLHGGYDTQSGKAVNILRVEKLDMFYTVTAVAFSIIFSASS
jgi:hypothetical protein